MSYAVTLRLDDAAAEAVAAMWRALAEAGIDDDRHTLGYAAHITLGIYPDDTPATALRTALDTATHGWTALPVTLAGFGVFPSPSPILWLAPAVTPALLARHAALQAALPGLAGHPHYRPGAWVPHVTLSGSLRDPAAALDTLLPLWRPVTGLLDRVELVRFRPVEVLWGRRLD